MNRKSLPIVCAVFLVIAMTVQFIVSYSREKKDLMQQMEYKMELAQKDFIFEVYDMHEATDEIAHFFPEFEGNTDDLCALMQTVLGHYPDLYCCYITFLPECSPIDQTAKAIVLLATTPKECTVFQPYNTHTRLLGNVLQVLDKLGTEMQFVEPEAFGMAIQQAALDSQKAPLLTTMLAYQNIAHGQPTQIVDRNNEYTSQVLLRLGFRWTEPDNEYIGRMLTAISQLGFFDV